jgi:hypothetical protein
VHPAGMARVRDPVPVPRVALRNHGREPAGRHARHRDDGGGRAARRLRRRGPAPVRRRCKATGPAGPRAARSRLSEPPPGLSCWRGPRGRGRAPPRPEHAATAVVNYASKNRVTASAYTFGAVVIASCACPDMRSTAQPPQSNWLPQTALEGFAPRRSPPAGFEKGSVTPGPGIGPRCGRPLGPVPIRGQPRGSSRATDGSASGCPGEAH